MSPDTLRKLREWLTLKEAASELATALSEDVDASDVLRLALDGLLKLSINLPAKTTAHCRKLGDDAPDAPWTRRTIDGVWDVPMVGRGKSQIEHDYQWERAGLYVPKDAPAGALVEQDDLVCQVPPDRGSPVSRRDLSLSSQKGASLVFAGRRLRRSSGNTYPSKRRPLILSIDPLGNANERRS